jgi:outer membrane protein OmpA-like peptidoglycan-associated protein
MKNKTALLIIAAIGLFLTVQARMESHDPSISKLRIKANVIADMTKNLEYDFDKPSIRSDYYQKLDQLAKTIKDENFAVSLRGHADSIGRYKYNWMLSEYRAVSVKKYLVSKGVKPERIVTTPFGSTVPIATNKTAAGRQKNRRVEIGLKKIS